MRAQALAVLILTAAVLAAVVCPDTRDTRGTDRLASAPAPEPDSIAAPRGRSELPGPPYVRAPRRGQRL